MKKDRRINEMSMQEIMQLLGKDDVKLKFTRDSIEKFCYDVNLIKEMKTVEDSSKLKRILLENEVKIDKEKLLFVTWLTDKTEVEKLMKEAGNKDVTFDYQNLRKILKELRIELEKSRKNPERIIKSIGQTKLNINAYRKTMGILKNIEKQLSDMLFIQEILKGSDIYLTSLYKEKDGKLRMEVISSQEEFSKSDTSKLDKIQEKNQVIFDQLDEELKDNENKNTGMWYILQSIDGKDLKHVMPEGVAECAGFKINENVKVSSKKEFERVLEIKKSGIDINQEIIDLDNKIRINSVIPETKQTIQELLRYVDMPKLLLMSIKKIEQAMENAEILDKNQLESAEIIASTVLGGIPNGDKVIPYIPEKTILETEPPYSREDIEKLLKRIRVKDNIYIRKEEIEDLRKEVLEGKDLGTLSPREEEVLKVTEFTEQELREMMPTCPKNFKHALTRLDLSEDAMVKIIKEQKENWSEELGEYLVQHDKISTASLLELYYSGVIEAEF